MMNELLEIEKIKQLKARYFRALDTNDWELFGSTLAEDCVARYSGGKYAFDSREATVAFMSENMSGPNFLSMHHGHHPEIEISSETTATGVWYLQDMVLDLNSNFRLYGAGIYADEYRKVDGEWQISKTGYERTFECGETLGEGHMVMHNMFAD